MGQIYWHIGTPKTGTSAIQAFLTLNTNTLIKNGYDFPNPPDIQNGQAFQTSGGNGIFIGRLIANGDEDKLQSLCEECIKRKRNSIYSAEYLTEAIFLNFELAKRIIKKYNIKIIIYVRKQDELLTSLYNQGIKNHGINFEFKHNEEKHRYYKCIENLMDNVDKGNLIIKPYDKAQFKDANIYSDFLSCLGLELNKSYIYPEEIVNPSLTIDTLEFKKSLNMVEKYYSQDLNKDVVEINKHILDYVVNNQGEGQPFKKNNLLTRAEREEILEKYKDFNDKVARYIGQDKLFSDTIYSDKDDFKKEVNIEDYLNISKHILKKIDNEKAESNFKKLDEEIKKFIASYTADIIVSKKYETTEFDNLSSDGRYNILYKLKSKPERVSKFVEYIEFSNECLKVKSNGNDPFFIIDDLKNNKSKKLLIKIAVESEKDSFIEVFYINDTENFNGDKRNYYPIKKGCNTFFCYIEHNKAINKLRFDIGNTAGEYIINSLEVYGQ